MSSEIETAKSHLIPVPLKPCRLHFSFALDGKVLVRDLRKKQAADSAAGQERQTDAPGIPVADDQGRGMDDVSQPGEARTPKLSMLGLERLPRLSGVTLL